jgi:adenylate kinase family enzyme
MARPQPRYEPESNRRGINAILLGAPGSGKGTQVSENKSDPKINQCELAMIAQQQKKSPKI